MKKADVLDQLTGTEIAIIGMNCRLPGANNIDEYWNNLAGGVESIRFFTDEELKAAGVDPATLRDPHLVKAGTVLDNIDKFDPAFFGMTPREAEIMDPQHRWFLECSWEALELSGYDPEAVKGRIGVFAGVFMSTYLFNLYSNPRLFETVGELAIRHANEKDYLATRTSYKFNLRGPSVTLQTSCSTSLVAVHMACQNLLSGECDMALAGGVSITTPQGKGYFYQDGGILSPDGHCRPFDAKAKGTVFGDGITLVVLKRLEDAINDNDNIYAVIKGSAINNDGSDKVGYTAPSVSGQSDVIADALALADVYPESISYVETHGTGTAMGDPIEISALSQVFRANTEEKQFCAIGSVKSNIGHLGAASGAAGLIKTALALKNGLIPPSLNFDEPNPNIDFENSPFFVNTELREWQSADGEPRRAGVSSFGMGGTNAHVVLEEAPQIDREDDEQKPFELLVLSAKNAKSLDMATANLAGHLEAHPDLNLADVAYTYQAGRRAFKHKRFVVAQSTADAVEALRDAKRITTGHSVESERQAAFLFPGQGSQYVNMGRELYESEAVFREQVDACSFKLKAHLGGLDLRTLFYPAAGGEEAAAEQLKQTYLTQPALFVVEYAMAQQLIAWGIQPQAMIGHSIGEYVAACLAGVLTLDDALRLIALRGRLMQDLPSGAMLAVPLAEADLQAYLSADVSVAVINAPTTSVLAGPHEAIAAVEAQLQAQGIDTRRLHTSHAFHSAMMDPILDAFTAEVRKVKLSEPTIPYISNVTGTWITAAQATDPAYYAKHLRNAVRFAAGVQELLQDPARLLLEVGPGQALTTVIKRTEGQGDAPVFATMRHPQDKQSDVRCLLTAIGNLWLHGLAPDWSLLHGAERNRLPLPTYAFDRDSYWIAAQKASMSALDIANGLGARKSDADEWYYIPSWKRTATPAITGAEKVLLLADETDLAAKLAARLSERGHEVVTEGTDAQKIVLFATDIRPRAAVERLQEVAQAAEGAEVIVITTHAHAVSGEETLCPLQGQLPALARALKARSVDIVVPEADSKREGQLLGQLLAEVASGASDDTVAYRGHHRHVLSYEAARLEDGQSAALRTGGVYLITDITDARGYAFAEHAAKTVQAKLVLLAPTEHDLQLEALGAEVLTMTADVTDAERMQFVFNEIKDRFGTLHGVFYNTTRPEAKIEGVRILDGLLGEIDLDFFLLNSPVGHSAEEAMANAALDTYAHLAFGQCGNVISIRWPEKVKLTAAEELEALTRILNQPMPQVIVASQGLEAELAPAKQQAQAADDSEQPAVDGPRNETERIIAEIWIELFGIKQVGIHDNFFELGGNSLLAVQFTSRVRNVFQVELNLDRLFDEPTIAGLAKLVSEAQNPASTDAELEALLLEMEDDVDLDALLNELSNQKD